MIQSEYYEYSFQGSTGTSWLIFAFVLWFLLACSLVAMLTVTAPPYTCTGTRLRTLTPSYLYVLHSGDGTVHIPRPVTALRAFITPLKLCFESPKLSGFERTHVLTLRVSSKRWFDSWCQGSSESPEHSNMAGVCYIFFNFRNLFFKQYWQNFTKLSGFCFWKYIVFKSYAVCTLRKCCFLITRTICWFGVWIIHESY